MDMILKWLDIIPSSKVLKHLDLLTNKIKTPKTRAFKVEKFQIGIKSDFFEGANQSTLEREIAWFHVTYKIYKATWTHDQSMT